MAISILLLEPHEDARVVYTEALRAAGYDVVDVADPERAYDRAVSQSPDVIVLGFDASSRDDRFGLAERLVAGARRRSPILLTSTTIGRRDLELATRLGVLALALESANPTKLVSAVQGVVAAHRKPLAARASLKPPAKDRSSRSR